MTDNRNLFLAMALSIMVLLGWQYFVAGPKIEEQRQRAAQEEAALESSQSPSTAPSAAPAELPSARSAPTVGGTPQMPNTDGESAAPDSGSRVAIVTPNLKGSISNVGGRIDDLSLTQYRATVESDSEQILLFAPSGTREAYYAEFGWSSADSSIALPNIKTVWQVTSSGDLTPDNPLKLTWDNGQNLRFNRQISIDQDFLFTIADSVENGGADPVTLFPFGLISRHGTPATTGFFILHEGFVGVLGEQGLQEVDYDDVEEETPTFKNAESGWIGITDKYWASALVPPQGTPFTGRYSSSQIPGRLAYQADFLGAGVTVQGGSMAAHTTQLFAGAKQVSVLDRYETDFGIDRFELMIDWGWFYFITKPLFYLIDWFNKLIGNFGLAILAVTVILKGVFFPLAHKSYTSMAKMKKVQPEMNEIKEKHGDDRAAQQKAMMELYKSQNINPLAGCLPILLQIPVFFALYKVLFVTIEMRHAPFFGWIQDLAAPDPTTIFNLFGLLPYSVPEFLLIGVWPLLMGITMFIQMKLNPTPTDKTQAMIFNWMPVMFTFMLARFPAGLVIYWAWNNFLSILQQAAIMRSQGVKIELWGNLASLFNRKSTDAG